MLSGSAYGRELILTPTRGSHPHREPRRRQLKNGRQRIEMSGSGSSSTGYCQRAREKVESAAQGLEEEFAQVDSVAKVNVKRVRWIVTQGNWNDVPSFVEWKNIAMYMFHMSAFFFFFLDSAEEKLPGDRSFSTLTDRSTPLCRVIGIWSR